MDNEMHDKFSALESGIIQIEQMAHIISDTLVFNDDNGTDANHLVPLSSILCNHIEQLSAKFDELQYDIIRLLQN